MSHLLAILVVQTATAALAMYRVMGRGGAVLGKVDLMVEEGGLRRRCGQNRDLCHVSFYHAATRQSRQTHSLVVEQEDLHLGRGGAGCRTVPG